MEPLAETPAPTGVLLPLEAPTPTEMPFTPAERLGGEEPVEPEADEPEPREAAASVSSGTLRPLPEIRNEASGEPPVRLLRPLVAALSTLPEAPAPEPPPE